MVSPLNMPINPFICQGDGTIFSSPSGGSSSGDSTLTFVNLSDQGVKVYANRVLDEVQFRPLVEGNNVSLTEQPDSIKVEVDDLLFDSSAPVKRAIPGLQGVSLNKSGILATLNELLYPTSAPGAALQLSPTLFEMGDATPITANWTATKTDEVISSISVNNASIPATGNTQAGSQVVTKTGLNNVTVPMQVTSASKSTLIQSVSNVSRKLRVGASAKNGVDFQLLDSDINNLIGIFSSTYKLSPFTVVIGVSQYLVIAIPQTLLGGATPVFKVNGFINNAFNLVRTNVFVNSFGYPDATNVYVTQTFATGTIQIEIS